ncbi:MAG: TIGR00282 family metallophosphoesterase [Lactobacillus sp.]|uniref:TIGR00282 family metallophosphoesterase n=1 Tax=Bombilactobacillus bombi TaxID=1303590 RepID=A0A347SQ86_9LACO|nr:TIGR00282 family metallophosphoesterase [Bombilactobacillus bombi]AXX64195.1 TIGR00282 family metallophosphoesterase [Bombilactobacillus bombi]MCO6541457.1 TIGR00282 family metallophosphoesterase [Lactobacillus sp.]MCO6543559.1 TIGR00282 family metallophosphoesterase [Lactobacillus sp.]RHW51801.1 TIGR00282 family metallophosphoesterase [Bombilactobacillus bombi]
MRIVFVGDVMGEIGMRAVKMYLPLIKAKFHPQVTIVNGENADNGRGIKATQFKAILQAGADVVTLGNHAWDKRDVNELLATNDNLLRPANYPGKNTPGQGMVIKKVNQQQLAIINLQGRALMNPLDDPFMIADQLLQQVPKETKIFVDFHAEATSEKGALAHYLDGRVDAVVGTHTHVQTNDAHVLPKGTAFLTDVGMSGSYDGILGVKASSSVQRFLTQQPTRYEIDDNGRPQINYCVLDLETHNHIQVGQINPDHPLDV